MKVSKTSGFKPVTITLESQEELDIFTEVFYRVGGDKVYNAFGSTSFVFNQFTSAGGNYTEKYEDKVSGSIYVK